MQLALFDLDHTLIPFDSGMAWTTWASTQGLLPADAPQRYLAYCQQYVDGTLDIRGMHAATVAPLAGLSAAELQAALRRFEQHIAPQLPPQRLALVRQHRDAGHRCVLVTATTRFIAEVFGRLFGLDAVLATESAWQQGHLTGQIVGQPCWRGHKVDAVAAWLAGGTPPQRLDGLARSWFYSDAASDLPLLRAVTDPVAVRPDAALRAAALAAGWPLIDDGPDQPAAP
ncbi:MAG: hydrolase, partial [Burkholderiales bacterium PBB5]